MNTDMTNKTGNAVDKGSAMAGASPTSASWFARIRRFWFGQGAPARKEDARNRARRAPRGLHGASGLFRMP